jgi:uncharacterized membrane protein
VIVTRVAGSLVQLLVTLCLIKKYYEYSWMKALTVAVVTVVIYVIILLELEVLGSGLPNQMSSCAHAPKKQ